MKKIAVLFVTLLFSSIANAVPELWQEGVHYQVINENASSEPNVTEFFSFYCPHCYKFEFVAREIEKTLPDGAKFKKSHVDFMRTTSTETQQALSRALVAAEKLNVGHEMVDAIFEHIHKKREAFKDEEDIKKLFIANGIDAAKYDKVIKSFSVKGEANKMKKAQDELSKNRVLTGVPMFIVNDKYKLLSRELRSMEDYLSLVKFLLAKKD